MSSDDHNGRDRLNGESPSTETAASLPAGRARTPRRPLAEAVLADGRTLSLREATPGDAGSIVGILHGAFRARPQVGAPPQALAETPASVIAALGRGLGYVAELDGAAVGCLLVTRVDGTPRLGRVSVSPGHRRLGIASFAVRSVLQSLAIGGETRVSLLCRREFPQTLAWWERHGFEVIGEEGDCWVMARDLPVAVRVPDADAMRALGRRIAGLVRPGDLIIASGELGAGKTTFTQGLGAGLGVARPIVSPTFVLARIHPSVGSGPALVHVDAYRLGSAAELKDLDLDATMDDSVTLVEWGAGVAEDLADARLKIDIRTGVDPADQTRWVFLVGVGPRWDRATISAAVHDPRHEGEAPE